MAKRESNASRWKFALKIAVALGVIAIASAAIWLYGTWTLGRSLRTIPAEPFETILKKAGSDLVVAKQPRGQDARANRPRRYLVAYEHDPEGFKADAKLFDTWLTATRLTKSALENGPPGNWVKSSTSTEHAGSIQLDPWGHPFCLLRRGDAVLAISGGPSAPDSPICKDVRMTAEELDKFPKMKLLQSPSGSFILVADKASRPIDAFPAAK